MGKIMNTAGLVRFFEERCARGDPLVLVTIYETRGSTYSKAGTQMLVDGKGDFHGMLSGGCLEGDLALRAATVIESGAPQAVTYDLAQDDELWGLGVGCDGEMCVFLQSLTAANGYQPFRAIADTMQGDCPARLAIVIESEHPGVPAGAAVVGTAVGVQGFGVADATAAELVQDAPRPAFEPVALAGGSVNVLAAAIQPPPRLLLLGGGPDAEPVLRFAAELGWRCTVVDHRDAYIESGRFGAAEKVVCLPAGDLGENLDLSHYDAAIVMSHHLASDRAYLGQLAGSNVRYIGLLGPAARRDRLLSELGEKGKALTGRLHGPAGIDLGGRGPAAIALSIIAEVQGVLQGRIS
jgi:xanthine/CO dehydrogenase XdhC/CoxF family maturation factor